MSDATDNRFYREKEQHSSNGQVIRDYRDAVNRFLTALSNPGGHLAIRNEPGTPYHELVLAGMKLDAMLADEPPACTCGHRVSPVVPVTLQELTE